MKYLFFFIVLVLVGNALGQSKKDKHKSIIDEITQGHKESLKKASPKIKISILKDAKFKDNEGELRLWTIDHFFIECFILRRKSDQWQARFISFDNQEGKMKRDDFLKPKNGWQNLNQYLKDNKLDFDLQITPEEENFPIHPDALDFVIEGREGKKYSMYWYIFNTNSKDGKRVQNLCKKISEEFNIDFVCKYDVE